MAAMDLNYRGPIRRLDEIKNARRIAAANNNDNASNDPPIVVAPPSSQNNQSNDQTKMLAVREDSASAGDNDGTDQPIVDNDDNIR